VRAHADKFCQLHLPEFKDILADVFELLRAHRIGRVKGFLFYFWHLSFSY